MNETTVRNIGALAAVTLVALAALSMPVLADAPSIDTETDNTTATSELQDGTTIDNFTADSGTNSTLSTYDDDNVSRVVEVVDGDYTLETLSENATYVSEATTGVTRYFYNRTISHDVFEYAEVTAGEQHNVSLKIYNTSDSGELSANNTSSANITVTLNASDGRTLRRISNGSDALEFNELGLRATVPFVSSSSDADLSQEGLGVSGDSTDVILSVNDADAQDNFTSSLEEADSGQWAPGATATVDGDLVPVFKDEASGMSDGDTYAVYDTDSKDVVFNLGDDYSDADSVDVGIESDDLGVTEAFSLQGVSTTTAIQGAWGTGGIDIDG